MPKLITLIALLTIIAITMLQIGCHGNKAKPVTGAVKIRPSLMKIVNEIAKRQMIEGELVAPGSTKPAQWQRFEKICKTATNDEIRILTENKSPAVRCYAFNALTQRKDTAIFRILLAHLRDTAHVFRLVYDFGGPEIVRDYFVDLVFPDYYDRRSCKLSLIQQEKFDSLVLFDKNICFYSKEKIIASMRPNLKNYNRIREMAQKEDYLASVIALSRFKNQNDTAIINFYLQKTGDQYCGAYAVREFPDPKFYTNLITIFNKQWRAYENSNSRLWAVIYQALVQYPGKKTVELFERTLSDKNGARRETLSEDLLVAITKYPNPVFKEIKNEIKLDFSQRKQFNEDMK